jgi:thiol-disulfide isomerase/thioredoxin
MEAVGKPVAIQYTALDGRPVDVTNMKGKVVLIDFWATWCGPCVGELPHVKEAYDKNHPNGFEIVGVSLDQEKGTLTEFIAGHKMEWPQYFDGQGWDNKLAGQFGITSIPAMWLIDKKGNLRDLHARSDLSGKVEKLLAE